MDFSGLMSGMANSGIGQTSPGAGAATGKLAIGGGMSPQFMAGLQGILQGGGLQGGVSGILGQVLAERMKMRQQMQPPQQPQMSGMPMAGDPGQNLPPMG